MHTQTAKPLKNLQIEFYDNLDASADDFSALVETPRPCRLLNPNLQPWQYSLLNTICYVVPVDYEGTEHLAVLWGFYRAPRDTVIKPQIHDLWNELADLSITKAPNISPCFGVFTGHRATPLSNRKSTISGMNSLKKRKNKCQMQLPISR